MRSLGNTVHPDETADVATTPATTRFQRPQRYRDGGATTGRPWPTWRRRAEECVPAAAPARSRRAAPRTRPGTVWVRQPMPAGAACRVRPGHQAHHHGKGTLPTGAPPWGPLPGRTRSPAPARTRWRRGDGLPLVTAAGRPTPGSPLPSLPTGRAGRFPPRAAPARSRGGALLPPARRPPPGQARPGTRAARPRDHRSRGMTSRRSMPGRLLPQAGRRATALPRATSASKENGVGRPFTRTHPSTPARTR